MKKYMKEIFVIVCILLLIIVFGVKLYQEKKQEKQSEQEIVEYEELISKKEKEIASLKEEVVKQITDKKGTYDKPYIPDGFHYVEGEWNNGYVIEDKKGNQFVWVPCRIYINDDVIELKRYNFDISDNLMVSECFENIENVRDFIYSVGNYEGFYIARYEAGKEEGTVVSKKNMEAYTNVSYKEAFELAASMYQEEKIASSLINSLAWDTTLKWIDKTTSSKYSMKGSYTASYSNIIQKTGYDSINRIYDLSGNVWEWSTERAYEFPVHRGGYNFFAKDTIGPAGYRDVIAETSKYYNIGFRVILYAK